MKSPLTVDVAVKGHHARSLGTAKGGVMQVIGQRRRHPGLRMTLGSPAVLGRVLFMSCSAVLKPHLWRCNVTRHHVLKQNVLKSMLSKTSDDNISNFIYFNTHSLRRLTLLTCITLLLKPVMSANFCSVWASGLLSWANWACMIFTLREHISINSAALKVYLGLKQSDGDTQRFSPVAALQWKTFSPFWPVWVDCLVPLELLLLTWCRCLKRTKIWEK